MCQHLPVGVIDRDRLDESLDWMERGTEFFNEQLAEVSDAQLLDPSRLPGWTRLHVVSHMARNARALMNLVRWAETGVESPMYPSSEARRDDIEAGARLPASEVRSDALDSAVRLRQAISAMPESAWSAPIRTALGWPVSATEIPWMRVREVWVHAVDLGASAVFDDIDERVAAALLEEAVQRFAGRDDVPAVTLVTSRPGAVRHGIGPGQDSVEVSGSTTALAGWMLGRTGGAGLRGPEPLPELPAWL